MKNNSSTVSLDTAGISKEESDQVPGKMAEFAKNDFNIEIFGDAYRLSMTQLETYTETTTAGAPPDLFDEGFGDVEGISTTYTYFAAKSFGRAEDTTPLKSLEYDDYAGNKYYLTADKDSSGNLSSYNDSFFIIEYNQPRLELYYHENNTAVFYRVQQEELSSVEDVETAIPKLMNGLAIYLEGIFADTGALEKTQQETYNNLNFEQGKQEYGVTLTRALSDQGQYIAGKLYSSTKSAPSVVLLDPLSPERALPHSPAKYVYYMTLDKAVGGYNNGVSNQDTCYVVYDVTVTNRQERLSSYCQSANLPGFSPQTYPTQYFLAGSDFESSRKNVLLSMVGYLSNLQKLNDALHGLDAYSHYTQDNPISVPGTDQYSIYFGDRSYNSIGSFDGTVNTIKSLNDSATTRPFQRFMDANGNVTDYVFYSHHVNGTIPNDNSGAFGTTADVPGKDYHLFLAVQKSTGGIKAYRYQAIQFQLEEIDLSQYLAVEGDDSSAGGLSLRDRIESSDTDNSFSPFQITAFTFGAALSAAGIVMIVVKLLKNFISAADAAESGIVTALEVLEAAGTDL